MIISTAKYIRDIMAGSFILLVALFFLSISYDIRTAACVKIMTAVLGLIILFSFVYTYGIVRTPMSFDVPGLPTLTAKQKSFRETVEERIEREKIRTEKLKLMHKEQNEKIAKQAKQITEQKTEAKDVRKTEARKADIQTAGLPPLPPLGLDGKETGNKQETQKESFAHEVPSKRRDVLNRLKNAHDINFFTEQKDSIQSYFTNIFDRKISS